MTTKQGVEFDRIINAPVPGLGATVPWHAAIMRNSVLGELRVRRFADIQSGLEVGDLQLHGCFSLYWQGKRQ